MKKLCKFPHRLMVCALITTLNVAPRSVRAQALEDSIEHELDAMSAGKGEAAPPPATEGAKNPAPPPADAAPAPTQTAPPAAAEAVPEAQPEPAPEPPKKPAKPKKTKFAKKKIKDEVARVADASGGVDEPNLGFEQRLYRIFHDAQPVSDETWSEMLGARREDIYHVQPGDTLWDISKTMFGDGFFWSKLWAQNRGLENPHRIEKGQGIGFIAGNEEDAPAINVVEDHFNTKPIKINALTETRGRGPTYREEAIKGAREEDIMHDNTIEVDELVSKPEIPPGAKARPVTKLPPSFEEPVTQAEDKGYDSSGLDSGRVRSLTDPANIIPTSFLLERSPDGIGRVMEVEIGEQFAMVGQNVFIQLKRKANIGEKFSVVKESGFVKDSKIGTVGPIVEVGGVVKVIGDVDVSKNVYRAMVVTSINPIRLDSVVMEEPLPRTNFVRRGTLLNAEVRVIGGEFDPSRKIVGENSIVYLDGGQRAGLNVGDLLAVQARRGARRSDSKYPGWLRSIGILKVVKVEKTVATAVIIEASEEIQPGDRTGGGMPESQKIFGLDLDTDKL